MTNQRKKIEIDEFPNDNWTRVEIFLRAMGRLPDKEGDNLTQKVLDRFCENYDKRIIDSPTVNLGLVYLAIKQGKVKIYD